MKDIPLISVIIPVYEAEVYLSRCVDSISNQTYHNLEIILINDGSADNSGKICDAYAQKDNRIVVIHQENSGPSVARNTGLDSAKGEYITFVDSDDWLFDDCIEVMFNAITNKDCDISICNYIYIWENGETLSRKFPDSSTVVMDSIEAFRRLLLQTDFDTSPWAKLYKTHLFQEVRFPVGRQYEDFGTVYKTFYLSNKIAHCRVDKYNYFQRNNSRSGGGFDCSKLDYIYFAEEIYNFVTSKESLAILRKPARSRIVSACFHLFLTLIEDKRLGYESDNSNATMRLIYEKIKQYRGGLVFYKGVRFKVRVAIMLSWLPYPLFVRLLNMSKRFNPINA